MDRFNENFSNTSLGEYSVTVGREGGRGRSRGTGWGGAEVNGGCGATVYRNCSTKSIDRSIVLSKTQTSFLHSRSSSMLGCIGNGNDGDGGGSDVVSQ
ncbi:hypothetical protein M0804_014545 [Polistes exclamans]|nr:hypothetical protein M0804_014546 [Polistes exclamans]KAI4475034.1 hypothetical protein M0804_014545 [Polistes exclamans]